MEVEKALPASTVSSAMLEPGPRYSPVTGVGGPGPGTTGGAADRARMQIADAAAAAAAAHLETAVDLSRKSDGVHMRSGSGGPDIVNGSAGSGPGSLEANSAGGGDQEDSEDEAPLDLTGGKNGSRPVSQMEMAAEADDEAVISRPQSPPIHTSTNGHSHEAKTPTPPSLPMLPLPKELEMADFPMDTVCSICGADVQSPDFDGNRHGENICGQGTYSCPVCPNKTFSLWTHYDAHKKQHQKMKQRQYPCQTCGKIFTSASNRNMHQRIHKGVRPFRCIPCGVFFRQKAHLQKHQKTQGHLQATDIFEKKKHTNGGGVVLGVVTAPPGVNGLKVEASEDNSFKSDDSSEFHGFADGHTTPTPSMVINYSQRSGSPSPTDSGSSRSKSSPKRKQLKPQQALLLPSSSDGPMADSDEEELDVVTDDHDDGTDASDDSVRASIDYNDLTHGYDCCQCSFSSHDLAVIKDHVRDIHLTPHSNEHLRCSECKIWFVTEYHLDIHHKKHDGELMCNLCSPEARPSFKVPNKLIKHMEEVHHLCSTCGSPGCRPGSCGKSLVHSIHPNKGFHHLLQLTSSLASPPPPGSPLTARAQLISSENRAAKKRNVDSLAETILQKKQLKCNLTNAVNGNNSVDPKMQVPLPALSPPSSTSTPNHHARKRKAEPAAFLLAAAAAAANQTAHTQPPTIKVPSFLHLQPELPQHPLGINTLVSQLSSKQPTYPHHPLPHQDLLQPVKSENNNVLSMHHPHGPSSLKHHHLPNMPERQLPPTPQPPPQGVRLPTQPVSGLTPPSSPSPQHQTRAELSVTIVSTGRHHPPPSDESDEETGLDLSMPRRRSSAHSRRESREAAPAAPLPAAPEPEEQEEEEEEEEEEVSTSNTPVRTLPVAPSAPPPPPARSLASLAAAADLYSRLPIGQPGAPSPFAAFPFGGILPPPPRSGADPALAEQLLKLAQGLPRPPVSTSAGPTPAPPPGLPLEARAPPAPAPPAPAPPQFQAAQPLPLALPKPPPSVLTVVPAPPPPTVTAPPPPPPPSLTAPYNVLQAMLGHVPAFQPAAFPGLLPVSGVTPTTLVTVTPAPPPEDAANSDCDSGAPSDPSKPFRCSYCRKEFAHLNSLESHMDQIHKGDSKHNCEECGRSFSSKSNLTAHRKIHSGERPFECQVCQKRFRQKAHLQKHETTHSSATPYQCTVCDKAFGHISNLNTHMATHSNVRPYQCRECGKSYKDSASFKRHQQTHAEAGSAIPAPTGGLATASSSVTNGSDDGSSGNETAESNNTSASEMDLSKSSGVPGGVEEEDQIEDEMNEDTDEGNESADLDNNNDGAEVDSSKAGSSPPQSNFNNNININDKKSLKKKSV